jgi:hypothetical protein
MSQVAWWKKNHVLPCHRLDTRENDNQLSVAQVQLSKTSYGRVVS